MVSGMSVFTTRRTSEEKRLPVQPYLFMVWLGESATELLDRKEYLPVLLKAWNAMVKDAVHPNGFLGYVQGTGKEPKDGQPVTYKSVPDFEDYGVGCFLLAGTEVYKLK